MAVVVTQANTSVQVQRGQDMGTLKYIAYLYWFEISLYKLANYNSSSFALNSGYKILVLLYTR